MEKRLAHKNRNSTDTCSGLGMGLLARATTNNTNIIQAIK